MLSRIRFSRVSGQPLAGPSGNPLGKVVDCVVRIVNGGRPTVTGLLLRLEGSDVFVSMKDVSSISDGAVQLATEKVDVRGFERRPGEVLLARDVLGRAVIDVRQARLVRVRDVILEEQGGSWQVAAVVPAPPTTISSILGRLLGRAPEAEEIEWGNVEPLVGHVPTAGRGLPFLRLAALKPADIADIVEQASHEEGEEILQAVHADEEFEADVFEELDEEHQVEFLRDRTDEEAAELLSNMEPDAAADLLMKLDQSRRRPILDLLRPEQQANVRKLLGYNPETAGGLMSNEFVALPRDRTIQETIQSLRDLEELPSILTDLYVTDEDRLVGSLTLAGLLRADPAASLGDVMQREPVAVYPDADLPSVAVEMADYNLSALPVLGESGQLLGVITFDDVIEAIVPEEWRWRGGAAHARSMQAEVHQG